MHFSTMTSKTRSDLLTFKVFLVVLLYAEYVKCIDDNPDGFPEQPPLIFPEDNTKYRIIPNNESIISTLTHSNKRSNQTEIYDMLHAHYVDELMKNNRSNPSENKQELSPPASSNTETPLNVVPLQINLKLQSELLQDDGANVSKDSLDMHKFEKLRSHTGLWAIVVLSITILISGMAYFGTILWRKILVIKYGTRQVLINEEDPPDDFKHSDDF
ncbi:uncharacterized protein LOC143914418 [Arctopsyche grandis]|uniref:uncharacterized protein LOC143914418 n=1 Tax=Arctopsyche grandis TaxID=121162 RepID=UPI00406D6D6A